MNNNIATNELIDFIKRGFKYWFIYVITVGALSAYLIQTKDTQSYHKGFFNIAKINTRPLIHHKSVVRTLNIQNSNDINYISAHSMPGTIDTVGFTFKANNCEEAEAYASKVFDKFASMTKETVDKYKLGYIMTGLLKSKNPYYKDHKILEKKGKELVHEGMFTDLHFYEYIHRKSFRNSMPTNVFSIGRRLLRTSNHNFINVSCNINVTPSFKIPVLFIAIILLSFISSFTITLFRR